ncbi:MAG: DUF2796 domain-containing protein [Gammaproteobacteria bacterium]|nr:DUF2796 domain-containing protein [Gammaproteobacteria bacterium]
MKLLTSILLSLAAPMVAAESIERFHQSHEHGKGSMTVVFDGVKLQINIDSPADSIVGFEHAPHNDSQRLALASAMSLLEQPQKLFMLPSAADCQLQSTTIDAAMLEHDADADAEDHDEHEEDHDEHEEDHDEHEEDHDEHEEDHDKHDENHDDHADGHSDFELSYVYVCAKPQALTQFSVELNKNFPQLQALTVQLIGPKGQSYQELDVNNKWVNF